MAEREREDISSLGLPRIVRLAWHAKMRWLIVVFATLIFIFGATAMNRSANTGTGDVWVFVGGCLLLSVTIFTMVRDSISDRELITRGECVVGRVTSQRQAGGKTKRNEIAYEFKDGAERTWKGKGSDFTFEYLVEAPVLVFYDQSDPKRNVAYCCTDWRIRLENGSCLDP